MTSLDNLERESESTRTRVAELLDELRDRVSPGELVDQVVDVVGAGAAGDFARNFGRQVRDNPLACAMVGAGIAWLIIGERNGGNASVSASGLSDAAARATSAVSGAAQRVASRVRGAAQHVGDSVGSNSTREATIAERMSAGTPQSARSSFGDATHGATDMAQQAGEAVTATLAGARSSLSDTADRATDAAYRAGDAMGDAVTGASSRLAERGRGVAQQMTSGVQAMAEVTADMARTVAGATSDTIHGAAQGLERGARGLSRSASEVGRRTGSGLSQLAQFIHDQPLIAAGLGLAIGAALGAALPETELENRALGERADEVKARAREAAAEQVEKAKHVAERTYEAAKEEAGHVADEALRAADEQGFPTGTLRAEHEQDQDQSARPGVK
ncbi:MAG: DUF3618 domain-containing protein [Alphaproteobacteria bacterium]|nr:DUF3618 domain-containing protein [Alphaproteobacteria bacterium]